MKTKHNLKPIYDQNSQILILGTMPSVTSREVGFYYAHPQNRFWKIMEILFQTNLNQTNEKIKFLHEQHIALWDTINTCEIQKSSDASIKNIKVNNIPKLIQNLPIKCIFTTGKKATDIYNKNFNLNIPHISLPSPSSANATYNLNILVKEYKIILNYLDSNK